MNVEFVKEIIQFEEPNP